MDTAADKVTLRPLAREDLAAVVAIDSAIEGRSRGHYFERRLRAALQEPKLHAQFAAIDDRGLAGFLLGRVLEGEFGQSEPALRLEAVGVRRDVQGAGIGERLLDATTEWARRHGIYEVRTQASWTDHAMLRWLDAMRFRVAPNHVLDCAVHGGEYLPARDDPVRGDDGSPPPQEIAYDGRPDNDWERLARDVCDVRAMRPEDVPAIIRIDRNITGRDRGEYVRRKLAETMTDSAIRVSLTARQDEAIVGYLMARVDLGDFGRTEPTAVIDTIGVDPGYAHRGVGHALVSQLFANLGALQVERVETIVAPRDLPLSGFLYDVGFAPSQRIAFVRTL
jgi:ribosomal protein S18 acetylase RimI-like enzyme